MAIRILISGLLSTHSFQLSSRLGSGFYQKRARQNGKCDCSFQTFGRYSVVYFGCHGFGVFDKAVLNGTFDIDYTALSKTPKPWRPEFHRYNNRLAPPAWLSP